jgi:hypothetical protein
MLRQISTDNILEVLKSISQNNVDKAGSFPKVGKKPKFSDLEVISLNLTSEYLSIESEPFIQETSGGIS